MWGFWRRRKRLDERAKIIQLMDQAILKEGGVAMMSNDEIRMVNYILFTRFLFKL